MKFDHLPNKHVDSEFKDSYTHICTLNMYISSILYIRHAIQFFILFFQNNNINSCPNLGTSTLQLIKSSQIYWNKDS